MTLQEQQVLMSANGGKNIGSPPFLCHQTEVSFADSYQDSFYKLSRPPL